MNRLLAFLRTVRGHFALFGVTFALAIVLAIAAILLRGILFERYVREIAPAVSEANRARLLELAGDDLEPRRQAELLRDLAEESQREMIYHARLAEPDLDPEGRLARRFAREHPDWVTERVRRTLVCGSAEQRRRALNWLAYLPDSARPATVPLLRYALDRGKRLHDGELVEAAEALLQRVAEES